MDKQTPKAKDKCLGQDRAPHKDRQDSRATVLQPFERHWALSGFWQNCSAKQAKGMEHVCVHTHAHAHRKKKPRLILGDLISSGIHRNHGTAKKERWRGRTQEKRDRPTGSTLILRETVTFSV